MYNVLALVFTHRSIHWFGRRDIAGHQASLDLEPCVKNKNKTQKHHKTVINLALLGTPSISLIFTFIKRVASHFVQCFAREIIHKSKLVVA